MYNFMISSALDNNTSRFSQNVFTKSLCPGILVVVRQISARNDFSAGSYQRLFQNILKQEVLITTGKVLKQAGL